MVLINHGTIGSSIELPSIDRNRLWFLLQCLKLGQNTQFHVWLAIFIQFPHMSMVIEQGNGIPTVGQIKGFNKGALKHEAAFSSFAH